MNGKIIEIGFNGRLPKPPFDMPVRIGMEDDHMVEQIHIDAPKIFERQYVLLNIRFRHAAVVDVIHLPDSGMLDVGRFLTQYPGSTECWITITDGVPERAWHSRPWRFYVEALPDLEEIINQGKPGLFEEMMAATNEALKGEEDRRKAFALIDLYIEQREDGPYLIAINTLGIVTEYRLPYTREIVDAVAGELRKLEEAARKSAEQAKQSEEQSGRNAEAAKGSEDRAAQSEKNAKQSAGNAAESERISSEHMNNAANSAQKALNSETAAKQSEDAAKQSEIKAGQSEQNAAMSETNAAQSEKNAEDSETGAGNSLAESEKIKAIVQQVMKDFLAMLGTSVATLVDGKVPFEQIPATATVENIPVKSEEELVTLNAQRGDIAFMIGMQNGDMTILKSWKLLGDDPKVRENWVVHGASYSVTAGTAQVAMMANDSERINGKRLVTMNYSDFVTAVKDPETLYGVDMEA